MEFDLAIIGAGPAGLSFALSMRDSGLNIVVIEKQTREQLADPAIDGRDIALTHLSRRIMQQHGSWDRVDPNQIAPLMRAEVIDGDSPYTLDFDTPADDTDALGFLIPNYLIRKAIFEEFETLDNVTLLDGCGVKRVYSDEQSATLELEDDQKISAELIVAADTRFSDSRRQMGISANSYDFGRSAVLCWMDHDLDHHQTAFECFHYGRTLAILPLNGNRSSVVITAPSNQVNEILNMSEYSFNQDIEQRLGGRLGKMMQVGNRFTYPLVGVHANRFYTNRYALIGDAAVGMHPVTAHGFNLGLSGQDLLATEINKAQQQHTPIWNSNVLQRYQQQHMLSTRPLYHGTNGIVSLFTNDSLPATLVRKAVLRLSNNLPPVKWAITQKLMTKNHIKLPSFLSRDSRNEESGQA
jgi:ubiquinone biosynthesis UbiH/UbiF/VisC/COQ6 family hydroxylase